jgi:hypothetical protein
MSLPPLLKKILGETLLLYAVTYKSCVHTTESSYCVTFQIPEIVAPMAVTTLQKLHEYYSRNLA